MNVDRHGMIWWKVKGGQIFFENQYLAFWIWLGHTLGDEEEQTNRNLDGDTP
jgi:hypothetical protein